MDQDDYFKFLEAVQDVWNDQYLPSQFVEMLNQYKLVIANPTQKPRSEADKKLVESKRVTLDVDIAPRPVDLADEAVKEILSVSETLHLNEVETVKLFYQARRNATGRGKLTLDVYHMYFSRRFHLLLGIHDLVVMYAREGDVLDPNIQTLLHNYFQDLLISHKFVENLLTLFQDLLSRRSPTIQKDNNQEIWLVCKILFYVFQAPIAPSAVTSAVGGLWGQIKSLVLLLKAHCRDNLTPPRHHSANLVETQAAMDLYRERKVAAYMIFFAIHAALSRMATQIRAWEKPRDDTRIKELARSTQRSEAGVKGLRPEDREQVLAEWSREEFKTLASTIQFEFQQWTTPEFKALLQLSWSICCHRIYEACRIACTDFGQWEPSKDKRNFEEGMLRGLRQGLDIPPQAPQKAFPRLLSDFLKSARLCEDDQREFINGQVGDFVKDTLDVCEALGFLVPGRISVLHEMLGHSGAIRDTYPISKESNSTALLAVVTHVVNVMPDLFFTFVNSRAFVSFIQADLGGNSGQLNWSPVDAKSPMFALYVDLFEAMCLKGDPVACGWVEDRLKSALNQRLCWEAIRGDLDRFLHQLLPDRFRGRPAAQVVINERQSEEIGNILRLIRAVAAWPGNTLGEMFNKMIELLGCRLHTKHKAEVFKSIAVFAGKRSSLIWQRLEEAQVISTRPRLADNNMVLGGDSRALVVQPPPEGMALELEVECEQKKYSLTTAFCSLILTLLCSAKPPAHLGSHYRAGGISPYTDFIRDSVLKPLFNRNYETKRDMWQLAEVALAVCVKILEEFDRSFKLDPSLTNRTRDPGYKLMVALLCDSEFSNTLMRIVAEGSRQLEENEDKDPEVMQYVEASLLFVLRLLSQATITEPLFITRVGAIEPRPESVGKMLLKRCDISFHNEVEDIGKAIGYIQKQLYTQSQVLIRGIAREDATELAYHAVSIFSVLSALRPDKLHGLQTHRNPGLQAAFCNQLQYSPVRLAGEEVEITEEGKVDLNRTRLALVTFLIDQLTVPHSANLTHYLLGFEVNETPAGPVARLKKDKQCLDVLLNLVRKPQFAVHNASLAEYIFQLFHELASNKYTCSPFIEYTHTFRSDMLFLQMLVNVPTQTSEIVSCLMQRAWLMKTIALELHLAWKRKHAGGASWAAHIDEALLILGLRDNPAAEENGGEMEQGREMKLLELGVMCEVEITEPSPLPTTIGGIPSARCVTKERGYTQYNLPALKHLCEKEVQSKSEFRSLVPRDAMAGDGVVHTCTICNNVYVPSVGANGLQQAECDSCVKLFTGVLQQASEWNEYHLRLFSWMSAFEGWKRLVEVLLHECVSLSTTPDSEDRGEYMQHCLLELMNFLLRRLTNNRDARGWALMGEEISALALTVMSKLREQKEDRNEGQSAFLLELIVSAILNHVNSATRMHLYATFLNCLQYQTESSAVPKGGPWEVSGLDQLRDLRSRSLRLLMKRSDHLIRVVTRDANEGDSRLRAMAFVFLTALLNHQRAVLTDYPDAHRDLETPRDTFLELLARQGCIDRMLRELKQRDSLLITAIGSYQYKNYDQILNYESMLGFLIQFASSPRGSRHLIDFEALNSISCCHFLDHRPTSAQVISHTLYPSPVARHHQLLVPTLSLIVTMLTASDPEHAGLHTTVFRFLKAHDEVMLTAPLGVVLDQDSLSPQMEAELKVLNLTTLIFTFLYRGPLVSDSATRAELDLSYFKQLRRLLSHLCTLPDPHRSANDFAHGPRISFVAQGNQVRENQAVRDLVTEGCRNILVICSEKIGRIRSLSGQAVCLFGQNCRFEPGEGNTGINQIAELFLLMDRCTTAIGVELDRSSRKRRGEFQPDEKFEMDEKHGDFVSSGSGTLVVSSVVAPAQQNTAIRINTALCALEQALYLVYHHTLHFVEANGKCTEPHHKDKWTEQGLKDYKEKVLKIQDAVISRLQQMPVYASRQLFATQLFKKILSTLQAHEDELQDHKSTPAITFHARYTA